jgi:DNA-binding NarL/FixJ family response regulator
MNDAPDPIERQLVDAQAAIEAAREATRVRQQAVRAALDAGWTKYRIAKTLGVNAPTVDSIIRTLERQESAK